MAPSRLSHLDEKGKARMVDVTNKPVTSRSATARARVNMQPATLDIVMSGQAAKGDVLAASRIAGIMAAKRTHELIPLCHPLAITAVMIEFTPDTKASAIDIAATVKTDGKTGVEMEALTAVSVAALTIYDMCKALDRGMMIDAIALIEKTGGKSGRYKRPGS